MFVWDIAVFRKTTKGVSLRTPVTSCCVSSEQECKELNIQFHLLHGAAGNVLPGFVSDHRFGAVVTDFSPLREPLQWLEDVQKKLPKDIPLIQV